MTMGMPPMNSLPVNSLDTLLKCVCGAVDRSLLDTVSRLFAALRRGYPEQVGAWTAELFAQESYPHPKVMPEHKQVFLTQINMGEHREPCLVSAAAFGGRAGSRCRTTAKAPCRPLSFINCLPYCCR